MPTALSAPQESTRMLVSIRAAHTAVWALFAGCIVALPFAARMHQFAAAAVLAAAVAAECLVLAMNRGRCPLTGWAAEYTDDRRPNFDIYLPEWLARWNKVIFGSLYLGGLAYLAVEWGAAHNLTR